jgi:hypothetical protein
MPRKKKKEQKMKNILTSGIIVLIPILIVIVILWNNTSPPDHLKIAPPFIIGEVPENVIEAEAPVDIIALDLITEIPDLPGHDDIVLQEHLNRAFVTGMDGWIWMVNLEEKKAEPFVDVPLMAAGIRLVPETDDKVVFCSSHLFGETYPEVDKVGIYELTISSKEIYPIINRVPKTLYDVAIPYDNVGTVYTEDNPTIISLDDLNDENSRPLVFCNDLDISKDGNRIYFSEPFAYKGASMGGGAFGEAITLGTNGLLWCVDLENSIVYLVAQNYSFLDGVLLEDEVEYEVDYGENAKETSILITETIKFRIVRLIISGDDAGSDQILWDNLPGMPDGMDRDANGNIWVGLLKSRSNIINWVHKHPWIKHFVLRLPQSRLPVPKETGFMQLSPDGSEVLYYTMHNGSRLSDISVVVPGKDVIYLPNFQKESKGLNKIKFPLR